MEVFPPLHKVSTDDFGNCYPSTKYIGRTALGTAWISLGKLFLEQAQEDEIAAEEALRQFIQARTV
ncbi:hypothetical protein [Roseofilum reptotaenium]|uniref:hypothetical protein n=1 Tax=Roseofilum reptotaenium TaxID=1233427 RepID=UPI00232C24BF|nr:hypothetical protein [Roseofilum reptotaenium]